MQRVGVFVTLLACLFMFQSVWNVAAAFCNHERILSTVISKQHPIKEHFGHHVIAAEHWQQHTSQGKNQPSEIKNALQEDRQDHSDHLPSFAPVLLEVDRQKALVPEYIGHTVLARFYWSNSYQSPDLYQLNPPPVLTPLLVG